MRKKGEGVEEGGDTLTLNTIYTRLDDFTFFSLKQVHTDHFLDSP